MEKLWREISVQITVNDIILLNISFQSLLFSRANKYYLDRSVLVCRCKATRKKNNTKIAVVRILNASVMYCTEFMNKLFEPEHRISFRSLRSENKKKNIKNMYVQPIKIKSLLKIAIKFFAAFRVHNILYCAYYSKRR